MSVVLPAPFGPSRPKNSPGSTCEVDAVEGDDRLRLDLVDAPDPARVDGERDRPEARSSARDGHGRVLGRGGAGGGVYPASGPVDGAMAARERRHRGRVAFTGSARARGTGRRSVVGRPGCRSARVARSASRPRTPPRRRRGRGTAMATMAMRTMPSMSDLRSPGRSRARPAEDRGGVRDPRACRPRRVPVAVPTVPGAIGPATIAPATGRTAVDECRLVPAQRSAGRPRATARRPATSASWTMSAVLARTEAPAGQLGDPGQEPRRQRRAGDAGRRRHRRSPARPPRGRRPPAGASASGTGVQTRIARPEPEAEVRPHDLGRGRDSSRPRPGPGTPLDRL